MHPQSSCCDGVVEVFDPTTLATAASAVAFSVVVNQRREISL